MLEATAVESAEIYEGEDEPQTFYAEVSHHAATVGATYDPYFLTELLRHFAVFHILEKELENEGDGRRVKVTHDVRAHGCQKHAYRRIVGYGYGIEGQKPFYDFPLLAVCEALDVYPDTSGDLRLAERAERYFREHLADKLLFAFNQLLLESVYAATGQPVSAAKLRELERVGSMVNKCPSLRSRKPGTPPQITSAGVRAAFRELGAGASQKAVAFRLGVTAKGLSYWGKQNGMPTWKDMAKRYSNMESK